MINKKIRLKVEEWCSLYDTVPSCTMVGFIQYIQFYFCNDKEAVLNN